MNLRAVLPLFALVVLAGCPEQVGQQCPSGTALVGHYALDFQGQHPADECTTDAGTADGGIVQLARDAGGTTSSALCSGTGDAGPEVWLVISGRDLRRSDVLADGGFHFTGFSEPIPGTACVCPVGIDETFDGFLQTSGGSFAPSPDGGLPLVTGLTGVIRQQLSTDAGATNCACTLPCEVVYDITGKPQ